MPKKNKEADNQRPLVEMTVAAGVSLRKANLHKTDLSGADLTDADLTGANLREADLTDANLRDADLTDADLTSANLRAIKEDLITEILKLPLEIPYLRAALIGGQIDGSTYRDACACLAGTLARACGLSAPLSGDELPNGYRVDAGSPRERWFLALRRGDTPANSQVAAIALTWIDEALTRVATPAKV